MHMVGNGTHRAQIACATKPPMTHGNNASLSRLLFPFHYLCATLLVTLYLMVWDWQVFRAEQMLFYWPSLLTLFAFYYSPFRFHLFCGLVLWGSWSSDFKVTIPLSQPYIIDLFLIMIMIVIYE